MPPRLLGRVVHGATGGFALRTVEAGAGLEVELTSDGHRAYLEAVERAFGADVDYAQLVKLYGTSQEAEKRYSPAECIGCRKERIEGNPDPAHISTSYVERQNLTMRIVSPITVSEGTVLAF